MRLAVPWHAFCRSPIRDFGEMNHSTCSSCLQVDDNADVDEIKSAYRQLAKICHPDNAGEKGHNICILLNEVSPLPSIGT